MTERLLIRLFNETEQVEWLITDEIGNSSQGPFTSDLSELAELANERTVIVIVPAASVLLTEIELPPLKSAQLRKALPYLLEDQLISEVQDLHFAIQKLTANHAAVAVVEHQLMQLWLTRLRLASIHPQFMLPESLCLPWMNSECQIFLEGKTALVRTGKFAACAIDTINLTNILPLFIHEQKLTAPFTLCVKNFSSVPFAQETIQPITSTINIDESPGHSLRYMAKELSGPIPFNLLQDSYQIRERSFTTHKSWQLTLGLIGLWLFVLIGTHIAQYIYLHHQQALLEQKMTDLYQRVFPQASAVVEPKLRLTRELQNLQNGDACFSLLARVGKILHNQNAVILQKLIYREQELTIAIQADNFQTLEKLKAQWQAAGLKVKQNKASSLGKMVSGEFSFRG